MDADTLKKLGVAPKNESYVLNILRFLGLIDKDGNKVDNKAEAFLKNDSDFKKEFAEIVKGAYRDLFEIFGDETWDKSKSELKQFFRTADHSSDVVGGRQAGTFTHLAALAGHGEVPESKPVKKTKKKTKKKKGKKAAVAAGGKDEGEVSSGADSNADPRFGLTVRVEVNIPADGDQAAYDRIFKSIRKHLIDDAN